MILTESGIQDSSEFLLSFFSNLLSDKILAGLWIGFDWQHKYICRPIILSKSEMIR